MEQHHPRENQESPDRTSPVYAGWVAFGIPFFTTTLVFSLGESHVVRVLWPQLLLFSTCFVSFLASRRVAWLCAVASSLCLLGAMPLFSGSMMWPHTAYSWGQSLRDLTHWESITLFFFGAWLASHLSYRRAASMQRLRETLSHEKQRQRQKRRIVEQQLFHSEQKLRDITHAVPGVVFEYILASDGTQGFTFLSNGTTALYGYAPEEILEEPARLWSHVPLSDIQLVREALRDTLRDLAPLRMDHRISGRDGTLRWLRVRGSAHRDGEGKTVLRGIVLDITPQKQAEEARRISEEGFRKMFEEHSSIMLLIEPQTARLLDVNPAAARFYGYSREILRQRKISDLNALPPLEVKRLLQEAANQGRHFFQFPHRLADQSIRQVEVHTSMIRTLQGEMLFSIIHDVTERISAQKQLAHEREQLALRIEERTAALRLANEKLQQAAKMKDEFLANISHELRTPLNAVLSISEILLARIFGELHEKQADYLRIIQESGKHLLSLINDLLDLSRLEQKHFDLDYVRLDACDTCRSSIDMIQALARNKDQVVLFSCSLAKKQREIFADERRLRQILVNLLSNAVKFTPKGGRLGVELPANPPPEMVQFTVWDEGIGIPPSEQTRLFQPFTQLQSGLDRPHEGSGLGLYLVQRLTELHQGYVQIESTGILGQGTRVHLFLPTSIKRPISPPSSQRSGSYLGFSSHVSEPSLVPFANPLQKPQTSATFHAENVSLDYPAFLITTPHRRYQSCLAALHQQQIPTLLVPPSEDVFYLAKVAPPIAIFLDVREPEAISTAFLASLARDRSVRLCTIFLMIPPDTPPPTLPSLPLSLSLRLFSLPVELEDVEAVHLLPLRVQLSQREYPKD